MKIWIALCLFDRGLAFVLRFYKLDEEYPEIRRELDRRYAGEGNPTGYGTKTI